MTAACYVIANWKCHKTSDEGRRWFDRFAQLYRPHSRLQVVVAPTLLSLEALAAHLGGLRLAGVSLAVQDLSPFPKGAYTGAVAADLLSPVARFALLGHSERRRHFRESDMEVVRKTGEAVDAGITPVLCVDDGNALAQLGALDDNLALPPLVAYTPVEGMAVKVAQPPARVGEGVSRIRRLFPLWQILYGGRVTPDNATAYLEIPEIAGVMVGEASLDAEVFAQVCARAATFLGGN